MESMMSSPDTTPIDAPAAPDDLPDVIAILLAIDDGE
jgi:hypothetical protein